MLLTLFNTRISKRRRCPPIPATYPHLRKVTNLTAENSTTGGQLSLLPLRGARSVGVLMTATDTTLVSTMEMPSPEVPSMAAVMVVTGASLEMSGFRPGRGTVDRRPVRRRENTPTAGMVRAIILTATAIEIVEVQDAVVALAAPTSTHISRATTEMLHAEMTEMLYGEMTAMLHVGMIVAAAMTGTTDDMTGTDGVDPTTTNGLGTAGREVEVGHQSGTETGIETEIAIATCTADRKTDHLILVTGAGTGIAAAATTASTTDQNLVPRMAVGGAVVS